MGQKFLEIQSMLKIRSTKGRKARRVRLVAGSYMGKENYSYMQFYLCALLGFEIYNVTLS